MRVGSAGLFELAEVLDRRDDGLASKWPARLSLSQSGRIPVAEAAEERLVNAWSTLGGPYCRRLDRSEQQIGIWRTDDRAGRVLKETRFP